MKTVLTELIEKWEGSYIPNGPIYKAFIEEAKTFLEKERQQISNAYEKGAFEFQGSNKVVTNGDGLDYFEETYR